MKYSAKGKFTKFILLLFILLVIVSVLYLPFGLSFLTDLEIIFIISLFVAFAVYSKVISGYLFINILLNKIDNKEDIKNYLKSNLSKSALLKWLEEGNLLILIEKQLLELSKISSILFDIFLVYFLGLFILTYSGIVLSDIFIISSLAIIIVWIWIYLMDLFINLKFNRIFVEEINEFMTYVNSINNIDNMVIKQERNYQDDKENKS